MIFIDLDNTSQGGISGPNYPQGIAALKNQNKPNPDFGPSI